MSFLHLLFLFLLFLHALAFIFFGTSSFSLPVFSFFPFWARAVVFSMTSTPCWSRGSLPAPCLVSRRCSVSPGSAPMRLVDVMFFWGSCLRAPQFPRPLLLHFRGIEARFISQSLTLLLVGRAGWLHLQRRQNHLPAPPARTAPLRSSPSSALPEDSSHGSRERKNSFRLSLAIHSMNIYKHDDDQLLLSLNLNDRLRFRLLDIIYI